MVEKNDELSLVMILNKRQSVEEFTDQVKERKMAELFECFEDVDILAERKKAGKKVEGLKYGWIDN